MASLVTKWYGSDGCTGDDPPLYTRLARYMADIDDANEKGWPVLHYADSIRTPEEELTRICTLLDLPWDSQMMTWPKPESKFAYPSLGNVSLRNSLASGSGLIDAIDRYNTKCAKEQSLRDDDRALYAKVRIAHIHQVTHGVQRTTNCSDLGPKSL